MPWQRGARAPRAACLLLNTAAAVQITLDTGLMSLLLLDMAREPLVEMNLGGADALQGRSHAGQNRSGRHCKRPGVSAHMRESAPGLLQVKPAPWPRGPCRPLILN